MDPILPPEMARAAERIGVKKARMAPGTMLALAVLAGAFISLGAAFSTTVAAGSSALSFGVSRLLVGTVFSLGLILVVLAGAELFTGNNLVVMAWASRKVTTAELLRGWAIVYAGNFAGAVATAGLVFLSGQYQMGHGAVGAAALATAEAKASLEPASAFVLGVLCNALVCLAVWLTYGARTTTDKILAVVPPVAAFVAAGFEHSVANMYYLPLALFIKAGAPESFWSTIGQSPGAYPALSWSGFLAGNLVPVTIGNVLGGAGMVGLVYWFVYLRASAPATELDLVPPGQADRRASSADDA